MKALGILLMTTSLLLSGCGTAIKVFNKDNSFLVSAEDIDVVKIIGACPNKADDDAKRDCIASVTLDSRAKCKQFLDGLVLTENTTNTGFDFTTVLLSTMGAVFRPLNTVHGLAAGASVSTGWKNALNSNVYAKASIANYAQAIMTTYYKDMNDYAKALPNVSGSALIVNNEVAKIQSIHVECSLAAAQVSIAATLHAAASSETPAEDQTALTVNAPTAGDSLILTAISPTALAGGSVDISYTVGATDTDKDVAAKIFEKVNTDPKLKPAKINATAENPPTNKITLHSPGETKTTWRVNNSKVLGLGSSTPATAAVQSAQDVKATTNAPTPGHVVGAK